MRSTPDKEVIVPLALAMTLNHVACGADNNATGRTSPAETPLKQANSMKIRLRTENRVVTATLIDSKTARDFVSLLPVTLTMNDLFGREKFGHLPRAISEVGERTHKYEIGDVAYWSPGPDVAIYYRHDGQSIPDPGIIVIGKIDSGVEALNVDGSVKVTIELANHSGDQDIQTGRQAVTIFFSLSMLRRHLEELGHGYKLSEIKEALDILADTRIAIEEQTIEAKTGRHRRTRDFASILTHYTASTVEGDTTGDEAYVAMTFHPAATAAILQLAFYPINQLRVGKLKRPLARWLTTRMSHNYRQAKRNGFVDQTGYHISLNTILDERGLPREARLRANVESVRAALMEMKERRILAEMMPYGEKLVHAPSKRRPKIVDAIWILYPSPEFVEEIVNGNKEMSTARTQAGGNKGENKLLPGFQDDASRGK